jgi:hypothetical protein
MRFRERSATTARLEKRSIKAAGSGTAVGGDIVLTKSTP